jgi:hypothetical protein
MKLKFKHLCQDKYNGRYYKKGDIVEFEEERAKEILSNGYGFADAIKEPKEEVKEEPKEEEKEEKPKRKRTKTKA